MKREGLARGTGDNRAEYHIGVLATFPIFFAKK
jgi:hypothetical protein